jgi:hypothetical protein
MQLFCFGGIGLNQELGIGNSDWLGCVGTVMHRPSCFTDRVGIGRSFSARGSDYL